MTQIFALGLDTDQDLTAFAPAIKTAFAGAGCDHPFVMRYLGRMTRAEADAIRAAGLALCLIYETSALRSLGGATAGQLDGIRALKQVSLIGSPPATVAIFPTVDTDVSTPTQIAAVEAYFIAFDAVIFGKYQIGGYADGTAESALRADGMPYTWLAGAMGWDGSRAFLATGNPTLVQGPTIAARTKHIWRDFPSVAWPALPFDYDPDIALAADYGAWAA